ncbi:hypothetical protein PsorP6_011563 [Peronosclerospora sorghi]|uniref:Uncharacterized protein n=1 Tax=Peronosclerospora sorghi TaxID=230839 RepID=A0ACC0WKZ6_9STRA|nr:hypothetical protein PsorP6_011563 [Peronosclerospora sorghi]
MIAPLQTDLPFDGWGGIDILRFQSQCSLVSSAQLSMKIDSTLYLLLSGLDTRAVANLPLLHAWMPG